MLMRLSHRHVILFRVLLLVAVTLITWLATTVHQYPVIDDIYDKFKHILAFYLLALLLDYAYPETPFDRDKIIPLFAYGVVLEVIQYFLPYRTFSSLDLVADLLGIMLYVLTIPLLEMGREKRQGERDRK